MATDPDEYALPPFDALDAAMIAIGLLMQSLADEPPEPSPDL